MIVLLNVTQRMTAPELQIIHLFEDTIMAWLDGTTTPFEAKNLQNL